MAETVLIGILLSFLFYELTDIAPGGIVVPGLLALYIRYPSKIVYTLVISIVTYLFMKILAKYVLLFGKRRFAVTVLISFCIHAIFNLIMKAAFPAVSDTAFTLVSFTVAGIIASNMQKQGPVRTVASAGVVTALTEAIVLLFTDFGVAV